MNREIRERRWDHELVGPAYRVAASDASPLRVVAGPGTGKTFALMRRIARRLQEGADPPRILAVTFTRTAARDLANELSQLRAAGADRVSAGTLHSRCFSILSKADVLRMTGRAPRPLLAFEERFMLVDLQVQVGGLRNCRRFLQAFNAAWARLQSEEPGWPHTEEDRQFQRALLGWLQFHGAMLIGELVPETLRFLRDNPEVPYRHAYDHVLADEYQDLNRAEQELIQLLAEDAQFTVVGDEDQSIYSFKHAHPDGIREFIAQADEPLEECRRCPVTVIQLANSMIANNPDRANRHLRPAPGQPQGDVQIVQWSSMTAEAAGIADFIKRRIDDHNVEAGKVLVLCPRRQLGYAIRDALRDREVAAHSFFQEEALEGDPAELDECQAQRAFTLLCLAANARDRVALRSWSGFGSSSLRTGAWQRLRNHCQATGQDPWDALVALDEGGLNLPYTAPLIAPFRELRVLLGELEGVGGQALLDTLFPAEEEWADEVRRLADKLGLEGLNALGQRDMLRNALTQPELPTDVEYVRVMSLHKSKGLTADLVVVTGCVEGLIPTIASDLPDDERELHMREQRRLFYVALTRTRRSLVLSSVARLPVETAHRMGARIRPWGATLASRFMRELGPAAPAAIPGRNLQA
jgi:DNA helicase-2/ATP-dependent DNA helicase PcrA